MRMLLKKPIYIGWGIIFLLVLGTTAFFISTKDENQSVDSAVNIQNQTADLISEVGKLMELPQNEIPTIATVTEVEKLKAEQSFFQNAQNGDKVLIYENAKKAILYSPFSKKVVDVMQIYVGTSESTTSAIPTP